MKVFVLNGSPKRDKSDCLCVTNAFLSGLKPSETRVTHTIDLNVKPCVGCFSCWWKTPGKCIHTDDMEQVYSALEWADLVIYSMPLYNFGMPSTIKAVVDRYMPLITHEQHASEDGGTHHPSRRPIHARSMLITGSGFPNMHKNFEALFTQFCYMFGEGYPRIACLESPLMHVDNAKSLCMAYLENARKAGEEFAANGEISRETQQALDAPMMDPDAYREQING